MTYSDHIPGRDDAGIAVTLKSEDAALVAGDEIFGGPRLGQCRFTDPKHEFSGLPRTAAKRQRIARSES